MRSVPLVALPPVQRLAPVVPLAVRLVAGSVLIAHGFHFSPSQFGGLAAETFGLPFPERVGWAVTLLLVGGGGLLILGLLSRWVAIAATIHLTLAIFLWEIHEGFAPASGGGVQIPLMLIAGLLVVLVRGPGPISLDHLLTWDDGWSSTPAPSTRARRPQEATATGPSASSRDAASGSVSAEPPAP